MQFFLFFYLQLDNLSETALNFKSGDNTWIGKENYSATCICMCESVTWCGSTEHEILINRLSL